MCLRLERQYGVYLCFRENRGFVGAFRGELPNFGSLHKSHVVLVGGYKTSGILLAGAFYEFEKAYGLFLTVDNECAVENFMTAVFGINLGETEYFAICERAAQTSRQPGEIFFFLLAQSQTFAGVVFLEIGDIHGFLRLRVGCEDGLAGIFVYSLQHGIAGSVGGSGG